MDFIKTITSIKLKKLILDNIQVSDIIHSANEIFDEKLRNLYFEPLPTARQSRIVGKFY